MHVLWLPPFKVVKSVESFWFTIVALPRNEP